MKPNISITGLARSSARHPWRVLGIWLVVLALAVVSASGLGDALTTSSNFTKPTESETGSDLLTERLRGPHAVTETVIVRSEVATVDDAAFEAIVTETANDIRALEGVVASAPTYYQAKAAHSPAAGNMVSPDRHATIIPVTFTGEYTDASAHFDQYLATVEQQSRDGFEVLTVGSLSTDRAFNEISTEDLHKAETFSLPLTIVILVVVFGALVAASVPLVLAVVSIIVALGLTAIVGQFTDLSFYVVNMIIMIGLAVGIDYTLFVVSRYREERQRGHDKYKAIEIAGGTATRAVVFSGSTVILALMGMFLVPLTVFHSLGAGAILAAIAAVAGTLTLVPALLGLLGDKIDWPRKPRHLRAASIESHPAVDHHSGFWGRITRVVMARPAIFAILAAGILAASAIPYFDLNRGSSGIDTLPPSNVKTAYEILVDDFSVGLLAPVEIVIDGDINSPAVQSAIASLQSSMASDPLFGPVMVMPNAQGDLALLTTPLDADGSSDEATDAVWKLRNDLIPAAFAGAGAEVYVTGGPAFNADYFDIVDSATPIVFTFVLGLSFILLLLAFRSVVIAAKAIVMNLLSVGAAYGLLVLVFQRGVLTDALGFQQSPTIEAWVPIFLFCVLFGLSMDYQVFLLSRIREHYDLTKRNTESVAVGLQSTARIITCAALIMVVVFSSFATGQLVAFQQMGFGMAVAIFIDATIVRSLLVPSTMALLGDRNWYLPSWLTWLPNFSVEGKAPAPSVQASPAD
jgi:putative drug exporter of the RND superfamily